MRLFKRTAKKQLLETINELKKDVSKLEREVFRHNSGWVTLDWGTLNDPSRIDDIEEKVHKLAEHAGLEFKTVDDNFTLVKTEE
jgi:hypothetical protein